MDHRATRSYSTYKIDLIRLEDSSRHKVPLTGFRGFISCKISKINPIGLRGGASYTRSRALIWGIKTVWSRRTSLCL